MKQTQTGPALWALDANIAMAQGPRRILCGSAELTGACVLLPERVLELIAHLYGEVAERRAEKITEWESETEKIQWSDEEEEELVVERTLRLEGVFAQWARSETTRNDGTWQIADDTAESRKTALKMKREGIARGSTYQGVEEDAAVAAQALEAGCRWIASHNQHVLGGDEFKRWLERQQRKKKLLGARIPFVSTADEAIEEMLGLPGEERTGSEKLKIPAIAWEVGRPNDAEKAKDAKLRVANLRVYGKALREGRAVRAAWDIRTLVKEYRDREEALARVLEEHAPGPLYRTREAEERQVRAERRVVQQTRKEMLRKRRTRPGRAAGPGRKGERDRRMKMERDPIEWADIEQIFEDLVDEGQVRMAHRLARERGFPLEKIRTPAMDNLDWPGTGPGASGEVSASSKPGGA